MQLTPTTHSGVTFASSLVQQHAPPGEPGDTGPAPFVFWSVGNTTVCAQTAAAYAAPGEPRGGNEEGTADPANEPEDGRAAEGILVASAATTAIAATTATAASCCDDPAAAVPIAPRPTATLYDGKDGGDGAVRCQEMLSPPIRPWIWCCCLTAS